MNAAPVVELRGLSRAFGAGERRRVVLNEIDLRVDEGEFLVFLGRSGSGKSTLLNMLSGIDRPDSGSVRIAGRELGALGERELTRFRRDHIGIVFQFFNLIPILTVLENVVLPAELAGEGGPASRARARDLLAQTGLEPLADQFPDLLSAGEQQRVAIARALIREPALILADEPTGNLDSDSAARVMALLLTLTRDAGKTLVMATHDAGTLNLAGRVGRIEDGALTVSAGARQRRPEGVAAGTGAGEGS
ncbi:MAG: ABC transporter ATP-binding protein [Anaerolineaceae bacterium]|nr:ABC transporter ATP-binding protein [Anaerolineaceae bacterium]